LPENPILPKLGILLPSISPVFAVFPGLIERGPHPITGERMGRESTTEQSLGGNAA
jgi:hypothetical protein